MARLRPIRVVGSMVIAGSLLLVSPWTGSDGAQASPGGTATQSLSMTVPNTGVLTVTASGTVSWTYPDPADLGQLSFTNTLNDSFDWSVTAAMTDLLPSVFSGSCTSGSTNCLSFTNMQLTTSSTFTGTSSGASTSGMVRGASGPFSGTDDTPGTTMSMPKQVLMADRSDKGSYTQGNGNSATDNSIQPTSGLTLESGTYSGMVQYTITG